MSNYPSLAKIINDALFETKLIHNKYFGKKEARLEGKFGGDSKGDAVTKADKETEEKLNQAKKLLLDSFGNIEKTEVRGNYHVQSRETEATLDEIKSVLKDPSIDQKALADDFFENTIVKDFTSNKQAYKVYRELKGTEFAQRFKELESERLKKAGFGEFRL